MPQTTIYAAPTPSGPPETPPAVVTVELARLFGRSAALAGVSLSIEAGRLISLTGPNGAGKTTLLRILATSLRPSFGSAFVDGVDVARAPQQVRARIAYLGHANGLYEDLTAEENLRFAAAMLSLPAAEAAPAVADALGQVGLTPVASDRVRGYSAGMRRRLAFGRLLLTRPSLVLLDEPHAALDADGMGVVDRLIAQWHASGITVLIASHHADRVSDLADGWARLDGGLLTATGGVGIRTDATRAPVAARTVTAGVDS
jgi:heme ABC exporter ATP-binding subunit CcmA